MNKFLYLIAALALLACSNDESNSSDDGQGDYMATPLPLEVPALLQQRLPAPIIPADNLQTVEGVALGKKLFFDPILSADNSMACADCHRPANSFTDPRQFSIGITGSPGFRNSMPLYNIAWNKFNKFNWDGSATSLEAQAFEPVRNPVEMNNTWPNVETSLQSHDQYPELFEAAFGTQTIDSVLVTKALAQFMRTLISGNSKFDRFLLGEATLTEAEQNGFDIFMDEQRGDCFHCHGDRNNPLWTDNSFHNNGLDTEFDDPGLGGVTGDPQQMGLFKSPSLRNLAYTAPYMHDGRFQTLEEVIDHYSEGLVYSPTIDPLMKTVAQGGVQLSEQDKADLKAFLLALSDPEFITNPDFQK